MEDWKIEQVFNIGVKVGTVATLKRLGLIKEKVSRLQAYDIYSRKLVNYWRDQKWITGYSNGKAKNSGTYFKLSELEIASARMEMGNILPVNVIHKSIMQ